MMVLVAVALLSSSKGQDALVDALRERLMTAQAVAMAKHNSRAAVEDKVREREVIHNAVRQAVKMGIDADRTVVVFTAQIEASKAAQRAFIFKWRRLPPFSHVPDLANEIRPKLDRLTPIILEGLRGKPTLPVRVIFEGPKDPTYHEAWKIAIRPLLPASRLQ